jgi:hypothetical protein
MAGRFYFAWVGDDETTFDPNVHNREDEDIFSFTVEHNEGDFATLTLEIRNPRIGLLNAGRKTHAWLSYAPLGSSPAELRPLMHGRLIGIPNDINAEIVTLMFTARPDDFVAQKEAFAASLRVLPFYDEVFIAEDKRADPDAVLEARTELWHIDRVTGVVSTSDLLVGEDGEVDFSADEVFYDSVKVVLGQPPVRSVSVDGVVHWTQSGSGQFTIYSRHAFVECPTKGLASAWPKDGAAIGGGWTVISGSATTSVDNVKSISSSSEATSTVSDAAEFSVFDDGQANSSTIHISATEPSPEPKPSYRVVVKSTSKTEFHDDGSSSASVDDSGIIVAQPTVWGSLVIGYKASRDRSEHVRFTLNTDVQAIVTLPGDDEVLALNVSGGDVGLIQGASIPIGDVGRRSYFATDRGCSSVEYLLLLARANLILRSRVVNVSFDCGFERAIELSCRMSARVFDDRLPGGNAVGKIVTYSFTGNGDTGEMLGHVTISCSVGYGNAIGADGGVPTFVEDGCVDLGYQYYDGQVVLVGGGDLGYAPPLDVVNDDGLVFPLRAPPFTVAPHVTFTTVPSLEPPVASDDPDYDPSTPIKTALNQIESALEFTILPVADSTFETAYDVTVTDLTIPRGIDLEAASA